MYKVEQLSQLVFQKTAARWATAIVLSCLAVVVSRLSGRYLGESAPFVAAFPVVAFAAWCCGTGPSLLSIAIAVVAAKYWFFEPLHSLRIHDASQAVSLLLSTFALGIVAAIGEVSRRESLRLRNAQGELEAKVAERTVELDQANGRLSQLTARLLQLQDDERRHLARDLHDSVGQSLAVLNINLANIGMSLAHLTTAASLVKDSQEMVRETTASVRTLSYLLHPPLLDERGLAPALAWYTEGFAERSGIAIELDLPSELGRLARETEVAVFRVVQECLTNIHRHSGAKKAKIWITRTRGEICAGVEDDGNGIAKEKLGELTSGGSTGVGVRGMRERIRQLGGSLEIDSPGLGKGTIVTTRMPAIDNSDTIETLSASAD